MRMFGTLLFALLSIAWTPDVAHAGTPRPSAKLELIGPDGSSQEASWLGASKWRWSTNAEGARRASFVAVVRVPAEYANRGPLVAESSVNRVKKSASGYVVEANAMNSSFALGSGQDAVKLRLRLRAPAPEILEDGCTEQGMTLKPTGQAGPFYVGAACTSANKKVRFHLSFPEEAAVEDSTLFESKGKGELWRVYDLGEITAATAEIGRIQLSYKGKTYGYSVISLKKQTSKDPTPRHFSVGLGYANLSIQGSGTGQNAGFYGVGRALARPLLGPLGVAGDLFLAAPLTQGGVSFLQASPYAYLRALGGPTFGLDFKASFNYVSVSQGSSGIGAQATQPGLGAAIRLSTSGWSFQLEWMSASVLFSQYLQDHSSIGVELLRRGPETGWDWGVGFALHSMKAKSQAGQNYDFSIMAGHLAAAF